MGIFDPEAKAIEKEILESWAQELQPVQLHQFPAGRELVEQSLAQGLE